MVSELAQLLEPQRLNKSCKNTFFLLLYCESLNNWGVTELIKDYVKWEDSIERKNGNLQILKGFPQKLTELPLKVFYK